MDLELREAIALSEDRSAPISRLLPGSEDHDFYRCLAAQHRGALDEADAILHAYPERHGATARYERLRQRQLLYRAGGDVPAADEVRDWLGASHWHEAEVEEVDPTRPTRLAEGVFDGAALLQQAIDYDTNLSQVTEEGLLELIERGLDPARRRVLLSRLRHSPDPHLVPQIAEDLAVRGSGGFGSLGVHEQLTVQQLLALGELRPELYGHAAWVAAVVRRVRPHHSIDLDSDLDARAAYLAELWRLIAQLPPSINTLKAHVLWHALDTARRRDLPTDPELLAAYLQLPRHASYAARRWLERARSEHYAQLGADQRAVTGLLSAGDDEALVRDLLYRIYAAGGDLAPFAPWLEAAWLDAERAEFALLAGAPDADRATLVLGPARAAALRDRIELRWCVHNPTRFGVGEPIALDVDTKHVDELVVKVFRIDPIAYFQLQKREVNTDLDLDGLAASHELVLRFTEPPVRRARRRIELPMCARTGTYVIDLIGNGMSSRAVVSRGRLRHVVRLGAAGHVVTIVDEAGTPLPDARAFIGEREYRADERGAIVVPFSTAPGSTAMLLAHGDIATVAQLELARETYELAVTVLLEREALAAGRTARAVARVALTVAGAPASLALLAQPTWDVTLTDRHGVATTKSQPLELEDGEATALEWPLGDDTAHVAVSVRGQVSVRSEQRTQELAVTRAVSIAGMHATAAVEALYLARTSAGWVIHALGKSGEPRAQRPVTVALQHRWARLQVAAELATDAQGRVELGELPGVEWITATLGGHSQRWLAGDYGVGCTLYVPHGREVLVPLPPGRAAYEVVRRASLAEYRGGAVAHHPAWEPEVLAGGLAIRGLPPGEYELRAPGVHVAIAVIPAGAAPGAGIVDGSIVTAGEIVETPRAAPVVASIELGGDPGGDPGGDLVLTLRGASARTRVHALATRFVSALVDRPPLGPVRTPARRVDRARGALYVSGRELGDEYRYVLERRGAKRYPGLLLDKPSLLLNPWSRRATTTGVADARAGGAFAASPAPAMQAPGGRYGGAPPAAGAAGEALPGYDFLPEVPEGGVLTNLVPDERGVVRIPRPSLAGATTVTIVVDDSAGVTLRRVHLTEAPLAPKDLRLRHALDPARHATQKKAITPLALGERLVIEDLATAKVHLLDTVERAHAYLLALREDATLREFAFVTRWHMLPDAERRELYSKYACHELHLFLYFKDRLFFDEVVRPYLVHKRTKTFLDHWLLEDDLAPWLEPARLARLCAVERALLAQRVTGDDALPRILGDQVAIAPPDPSGDARLIDALLGASTLDADESVAEARSAALVRLEADATGNYAPADRMALSAMGAMGVAAPAARPAPAPMQPVAGKMARTMIAGSASMAKKPMPSRRAAPAGFARGTMADVDADELAADFAEEAATGERFADEPAFDTLSYDMAKRDEAPRHYRAADKTQEWAEHNWWHRRPAESGASMIQPSRLWRDLARHSLARSSASGSSGPAREAFLSPWLGLATSSFAEAMCALAVTELPFVASAHGYAQEPPRLVITAGGNALVGSSQILDGELVPSGPPLVVGTSYVRADDRHDWSSGEQVDKYVEGPLAVGVVYTCQVVLANPTSSRQRISALVQIPRGSVPVASSHVTQTIDVVLEPYGTHGHEYSFYFPAPGTWSHFPVHVSRGETIIAAAPARALEVRSGGAAPDPTSWAHVSQRGSTAEVVAYLTGANLAATELLRAAWRLRDRAAYEAILGVLERRRVYDAELWAYALYHRDAPRVRVWLRALGERLLEAGPVLDMIGQDAEELGTYEHLELSPLINARAHRLGPKVRILNDGLVAQYDAFLELVAHRPAPTQEDLLAAAVYLLAQDRVEPALEVLARVSRDAVADRMQYDYVAAYAACLAGDPAAARERIRPWLAHPVDRWRHRFGAMAAMLDEVTGAAPVVTDTRSREQAHAEAAAKQPTFELAVDGEGVLVRSHAIAALELRFFEMDVELLFSRQPFVQSDVSRFSFIEPGHREVLAELVPEHRVAWPAALRGKNVVVKAVGAGQRKAKVHYANDLTTQLANQVGQVRVQRASDRAGLPATYVKVYARKRGGAVTFYKDGYTDLRGWFDYASLSTTELDTVERFAILVCSDQSGASILETAPPVR